jgi:exodeoxyribonuclease V alpha subunit
VAGAEPAAGKPLRLVDGLLYLDRYWRQEEVVRAELDARALADDYPVDRAVVTAQLTALFPGAEADRQRLAAAMTALRPITVLAGGPGTGKTTTVGKLLRLLLALSGKQRIALAAPTGKAAARLQEAVREAPMLGDLTASTLHRLLGWRPDSRSRFRHHRDNRLPYDVVVVDETSMVSLTLMSRLLEAVRPDARLVLVGDPDQLASVEAGAVLGDIVERPAPSAAGIREELRKLVPGDLPNADPAADSLRNGVVRLTRTHRFGAEISTLAAAIRLEDPDRVLDVLRTGSSSVSFVETDIPNAAAMLDVRVDVESSAAALTAAASDDGDVHEALRLLNVHRLLCAHRRGPYGVSEWSRQIERWLAEVRAGPPSRGEWYAGQPLLVDANDYELGLFNGDTGVVVESGGRLTAAFQRGPEPLLVSPSRLANVHTVHAMTVHRAQGSQFKQVTLLLPPQDSPLLTRELFYTAITRAEQHVRVVGSAEAVRRAVLRPIARASGLRRFQ